MLKHLQQIVSPENLHSVDDVSTLLSPMNDKLEVIMSHRAKEILASHQLSPATLYPAEKQRVLTFNCTISGDSRLTAACIKFGDSDFE